MFVGIMIVWNVLFFFGFFNNYLLEIFKYGKKMKDWIIYLNKNYYYLLDVDLVYWYFYVSNVLYYNYRSVLYFIVIKKYNYWIL